MGININEIFNENNNNNNSNGVIWGKKDKKKA